MLGGDVTAFGVDGMEYDPDKGYKLGTIRLRSWRSQ